MAQIQALKFVKPYVIPDIGRVDETFGPFKFDVKKYAYRDAIMQAGRAGIVAVVAAEESEVRELASGMSLQPAAPAPAPAPAAPADEKPVKVQ